MHLFYCILLSVLCRVSHALLVEHASIEEVCLTDCHRRVSLILRDDGLQASKDLFLSSVQQPDGQLFIFPNPLHIRLAYRETVLRWEGSFVGSVPITGFAVIDVDDCTTVPFAVHMLGGTSVSDRGQHRPRQFCCIEDHGPQLVIEYDKKTASVYEIDSSSLTEVVEVSIRTGHDNYTAVLTHDDSATGELGNVRVTTSVRSSDRALYAAVSTLSSTFVPVSVGGNWSLVERSVVLDALADAKRVLSAQDVCGSRQQPWVGLLPLGHSFSSVLLRYHGLHAVRDSCIVSGSVLSCSVRVLSRGALQLLLNYVG